MLEVKLANGGVALLDDCDSDLCQFRWSSRVARQTRYAVHSDGHLLHRLVAQRIAPRQLTSKDRVDHKNRNGLDCRRDNLRVAGNAENLWNRGKTRLNTSGYKGVHWDKNNRKWMSEIQAHKKRIYLGRYDTAREAALAYNFAAVAYHGEFSFLNDVRV